MIVLYTWPDGRHSCVVICGLLLFVMWFVIVCYVVVIVCYVVVIVVVLIYCLLINQTLR